jgi:hypothetical protein
LYTTHHAVGRKRSDLVIYYNIPVHSSSSLSSLFSTVELLFDLLRSALLDRCRTHDIMFRILTTNEYNIVHREITTMMMAVPFFTKFALWRTYVVVLMRSAMILQFFSFLLFSVLFRCDAMRCDTTALYSRCCIVQGVAILPLGIKHNQCPNTTLTTTPAHKHQTNNTRAAQHGHGHGYGQQHQQLQLCQGHW